jgi:hypothetical protein
MRSSFAGDDQQQAVEVVADVLLGHGVLHQGELLLEGLLRGGEVHGFAFRRGQARVVGGGQGLQLEAALAGLEGDALVVEGEADVGGVGQGAQDVLQLAGADGDGDIIRAQPAGALLRIWISMSVASRVSRSPFFSISTLERIGRVWRFSTMPDTDCSGARRASRGAVKQQHEIRSPYRFLHSWAGRFRARPAIMGCAGFNRAAPG